ncbi:MAG: hypothetical protein ACR2L2_14480 [Acidobacteriota bacterium]
MKKLLTTACLFVVTIVAIVSFIAAPTVFGQEKKTADVNPSPAESVTARKAYPDFAVQAPVVNTSPGPEYAAWTRMFQGVPGIERTAKGRLLAAWHVAFGPMGYLVLVSSEDDGKNWSEAKLVIDPPGNVWAGNPALWRDPAGRLWLFWRQGYGGSDGRDGVWTIVSENPDDGSPTWSKPRRLAD